MTAAPISQPPNEQLCTDPSTDPKSARRPAAGTAQVSKKSAAGKCSSFRWAAALLTALAACGVARAERIKLKDGRTYSGKLVNLPSTVDTPRPVKPDGAPDPRLILMIDDNLRRYFVPKRHVVELTPTDPGEVFEKFGVRQKAARAGNAVVDVGSILEIKPFDEFGRRTFSMGSGKRRVDVIQGITEITPQWTKVEGLTHIWDQRIATSSIPRETLDKVLAKSIDAGNVEQRLKLVRFYLQGERYTDARRELEALGEQFPDVKAQFDPLLARLVQLGARRLLAEVKFRQQGGQHALVQRLLQEFPVNGVGGEILQEVRELLDEYRRQTELGTELNALLAKLLAGVDNQPLRRRLTPAVEEIRQELNLNTLDRLGPFNQFRDNADMLPAEKLSLAISGWLTGANAATANLENAVALVEIRQLLGQYLVEETKIARAEILELVRQNEAASAESVARLLKHMLPPWPLPPAAAQAPGLFEASVPSLSDEPDVAYFVQLPPEYDPHRLYPAVLTLHGSATTAAQQIDWWAGGVNEQGERMGQASRQGYVVIAPEWTRAQQAAYDYGPAAHAAVLNALRDACRRFSIDTDRVFLSGHAMGADAAWDIGLAHPDLWAGVIPVAGVSDRYGAFYWENQEYVPLYVVGGQMDGDQAVRNARDLDRCLRRGFPVTVAQFQGRGHEHFSDEILNLFDWMARYRRDFFPKEFAACTMRTFDNFFWWTEVADYPPRTIVEPQDWPERRPAPRGTRPLKVEAKVNAANNITIRTGADRVSVWLAPELVDFNQRVLITVNGQRLKRDDEFVAPDLATMLEDVRTRGDRQHPFWARFESPQPKQLTGSP